MSEWITCSERMPEYFEAVLLTDGDDSAIGVMRGDKDGLFDIYPYDGSSVFIASHWQPLPEPPKD